MSRAIEQRLARAVLRLAEQLGDLDAIGWNQHDIVLARLILDVPAKGRYTHAHLWREEASEEAADA